MQETLSSISSAYISSLCLDYEENNALVQDPRQNPSVKRGLRNADGTGVMAGYTQVGYVQGYSVEDGEKLPMEGHLYYRGYDLLDLIHGYRSENRYGFEEVTYLLLFGHLPTKEQFLQFRSILAENTALPPGFTENMIMRTPCQNIMNKLGRAVLSLYSYDPNPEDTSLENIMTQCICLVARFPQIIANAYAVKRHYYDNDSLYLHRSLPELTIAQNFLHAVRPDNKYTEEEARLLDLCLVIHAEHGGGNNSAFACRVLSSSGTDTYAAISAAIGSLKGPRHGGANQQVMKMFNEIKANVRDWKDDDEVAAYLTKILKGEAGDGSGLIYGMGHAIYTLSDPRAVILKDGVGKLAEKAGLQDEFDLMQTIERLTPGVFAEVTGKEKVMCANVDMYSGLVYKMLHIPEELYTPLFAMARVSGWCAHRIEEALTGGRIIRPAYKFVAPKKDYVPMNER